MTLGLLIKIFSDRQSDISPSNSCSQTPRYAATLADLGLEMAKHKTFTVATDVKVYFCDPQSP